MKRAVRGLPLFAAALFGACAMTPPWQDDLQVALRSARAAGKDLVIYFALAGRAASDRMQASLTDPAIGRALARGGFAAVVCDGSLRSKLYQQWIGGGEGMGICVLDGTGRVYAARPGPQDPPELAAFLDLCAASRESLAVARAAAPGPEADVAAKFRLGQLLLQLGCRTECEPLLLDAALAGVPESRHCVARLYALDGNVTKARHWLRTAPDSPNAKVTEAYVLFKERKHKEAAERFEQALQTGRLGEDRQRAILYLGKALHEDGHDDLAVPLLEALAAEGSGSTFEAAAGHTLWHIRNPEPGHTH